MGVKYGRSLPTQEQILKDLLDKLSSYNIFNFLLPGVVFAVFVSKATSFKLMQEDVLSSAFVYYFTLGKANGGVPSKSTCREALF